MCGRAKLSTDSSEIKIAFRIPPEYPTPNSYAPSWDAAPTDNLPKVRYNEKADSPFSCRWSSLRRPIRSEPISLTRERLFSICSELESQSGECHTGDRSGRVVPVVFVAARSYQIGRCRS
jgi:hypothetical protein